MTSYEFFWGGVGHTLRDNQYRYIYYEDNSLEELYDHQTDPNEFENVAYDKEYKEVVEAFRKELIGRVERGKVSMEEIKKLPVGYTIKGGKALRDGFVPMEDIELEE